MASSASSSSSSSSSSSNNNNSSSSGNAILVGSRQRGNGVLKLIENVPWKFSDGLNADFVLGEKTCALYLSLRYHLLNPDYLYSRIAEVRRDFRVRLLLVVVDIQNSTHPLTLLTSLAAANEFTVILCWTQHECARYLETFKAYEKRSASAIQEKVEAGYMPRLEDALCVIRSVNRSDTKVLSRNFGSLKDIMKASMEELALCQGIGDKKVRRIYNTFNEPFL